LSLDAVSGVFEHADFIFDKKKFPALSDQLIDQLFYRGQQRPRLILTNMV